jgi:hypothetical protein
MSTPTEKALEIANKMYNGSVFDKTKAEHLQEIIRAKEVALFAVDEIIKVCPYIDLKIRETEDQLSAFDFQFVSYWQEVKNEIEKL